MFKNNHTIDLIAVRRAMNAGRNLLIVYADDDPAEHARHHIDGSLGFAELERVKPTLPRSQEIVFYCPGPDDARSIERAEQYASEGFTRVHALRGGYTTWTLAFDTERISRISNRRSKRIDEIMTRDVECAGPGTTITDVAIVMKDLDIGSLPVCHGRQLVGVITDRDIAVRVVADGRDPHGTRVRDVMTTDVATCRPTDSVDKAERIMHDRQIRRLPITNDLGELVGYLSLARIVRSINDSEAGRVIKSVSQPSAAPPPEPSAR